jgi:hypothetical protein
MNIHSINNTVFFFVFLSFFSTKAQELPSYLFPQPKQLQIESGFLNLHSGIQYPTSQFTHGISSLQYFNTTGSHKTFTSPLVINTLTLEIDSTLKYKQQYILKIDSSSIHIKGKTKAALFYGKQTLAQIISYHTHTQKPIPCLTIQDWPDFERRGYMLDISRDKVPTMETLLHMIDLLAKWKMNEFQLYTEHTFAYKKHKVVWKNASPITAEEIQILDKYCKIRHIDLVPNQNSFGHMENWLKHDEYLHLAECPTDCKTTWGMRSRTSLNPVHPGSFALMKELYAELLPNFSSKYFNIGCDETVELGNGLSKAECEKSGKGKIYLEYLIKLNSEVNKHNRIAQFWGDIILNHPKLIPSLPQNMTAMVWGYESTYPFEEKLPLFKDAGLKYYVCPGTSTWRSIIGRNHDAFLNLKNAAYYGKKFGAKGYLNTNWGDYGYWQPLSVCYPTMAVGAAYSWSTESNPVKNLAHILNTHIFLDPTGNIVEALLKLGNAYLACNIPEGNANAFHLMLRRYKWTIDGHFQTKHLTKENLQNAEQQILHAKSILNAASPFCKDSSIVINELNQAIALSLHGVHLGIARLEATDKSTENIDREIRIKLKNELEQIIENHNKIWIKRNRKGGLFDSSKKLQELAEFYDFK